MGGSGTSIREVGYCYPNPHKPTCMDCRHFRENHFAFVDDTLPGIELVGMQMHLTQCEPCARHDANVRRSLMLFRNLPSIEPSPDFSRRLQEKLRAAKLHDAHGLHRDRSRSLGAAAAVAVTSAIMLGYIAVSLRDVDSAHDLTLPPVVAIASASEPIPVEISSPAPEMVAAVPAGLPIWTAALFAEQTAVHFASIELAAAR